ncbi:hypothetical protein QBC43DRAFT_97066 [Cladorrhinum sp. PSN259]|nr:hypothetical protein QBC43DRAFT_97066 [Cladorrhinum sp. PSN259]
MRPTPPLLRAAAAAAKKTLPAKQPSPSSSTLKQQRQQQQQQQQPSRSSSSSSSSSSGGGGPPPKWKAMLWTGLFAACTITGTFYGAGLKTQQEWKAEKEKVQEATIDERVSMLESRRFELVRQQNELLSKIEQVRGRIDATAAASVAATTGGEKRG